jgi:hypothetical protein
MITKEQYDEACQVKDECQEVINTYFNERAEAFEKRLIDNPVFNDEELHYSAVTLCHCGHGLAYPVDCGPGHYWECSAILRGIADTGMTHLGRLPFAFLSMKGESDQEVTTRGIDPVPNRKVNPE